MDPNRESKLSEAALPSLVENQRVELAKLTTVVAKQESLLNRLTSELNCAFSSAQRERHELRDSTRETSTTLSRICEQLNSLSSAISTCAPPDPDAAPFSDAAHVPLPSSPSREPNLFCPKAYDGDLSLCRGFIEQCELLFRHQPSRYSFDEARVAQIVSLLSGRALEWAVASLKKSPTFYSDYDAFVSELRLVFDHPPLVFNPASRLHSICQGSRSVAEYAVEFRILAAECSWNDSALMSAFLRGLGEPIRDRMLLEEPPTLAALIALALKVDNRLKANRPARATRESTPSLKDYAKSPLPAPSRHPTSAPCPPHLRSDESTPMQLGRSRLTPEVRAQRFRDRLCLYCGEAGHFVQTCNSLPKDQTR